MTGNGLKAHTQAVIPPRAGLVWLGVCFAVITCMGLGDAGFAQSVHSYSVPNVTPPVTLRGVSKGMSRVADRVVTKQLKLSDDTKASGPLADDLAFFVESSYRQDGYPEAQVEWALEGDGIVLTVSEGPLYGLGKLTIEGVDDAMIPTLLPYLTSPTKERRAGGAKDLPYVAEELRTGTGMVERKLHAEGYLDAAAGEPGFTFNADRKTVDMVVKVIQGPKYTFGEVTLAGDTSGIAGPLLVKVSQLKGQAFNEVSLESVRQDLVTDCQARGYFAPTVTAEHNWKQQAGTEITARLSVQQGDVFRIREVKIADDLSQGARHVADTIFHSANGEPYEPITLDLYTRRALETGIYGRFDVKPRVTGPGELALDIAGTEEKPIVWSLYGGYETFTGAGVGTEVRNVNFLNTGHTASAKAEWTFRGLEGRLGWIDPAIFGTRNALAVDAFVETFEFKAYQRQTGALRAALSRRFSRAVTAEIFTGVNFNEVSSDFLLPSELGPDSYSLANLGARLTFDYRDNPLIPHRGWFGSLAVEGDAGDVSFTRFDLVTAYYHPLTQRLRMALGARSSYLQGSSDISEIPIDLRNFNGGANSVRSFQNREMGPQSIAGGTPLGDFVASSVNAELSYKVMPNLEIAAFVDAGTLGDSQSLFSFDEMRYGVGLGLRYNLPIGPLRIDYGYNPDRREGEARGGFHLTFGFAF